MDNTTLPPTGDMSVDPVRDQPQKDGGTRYLNWNLGAEALEADHRDILVSLGGAVVTRWADLPRDVQKALFDAPTGPALPDVRESIAKFLHSHGEHHA